MPIPIVPQQSAKISKFVIKGLFGSLNHEIPFPRQSEDSTEPAILIIEGPNGCGKTTILHMIAGMLRLDFSAFRRLPFTEASLELEGGSTLTIIRRDDDKFPLEARFGNSTAILSHDKTGYSEDQSKAISSFRVRAGRALRQINYELLEIHRSQALRDANVEAAIAARARLERETYRYSFSVPGSGKLSRPPSVSEAANALSKRVLEFIQEAQVNYRRFFIANELELLPRLLSNLQAIKASKPSKDLLLERVTSMTGSGRFFRQFGLQTDDRDIATVKDLLQAGDKYDDESSLAVLQA